AELFVIHVFSKHRVPAHVTSDRGPEFVSHFFRSLGKALNITPRARSNLSKGQRICSKPRRLTPGITDSDIRGPKTLSRTHGFPSVSCPRFQNRQGHIPSHY